jgi:tetratricopeptide (TPR) repeat protein
MIAKLKGCGISVVSLDKGHPALFGFGVLLPWDWFCAQKMTMRSHATRLWARPILLGGVLLANVPVRTEAQIAPSPAPAAPTQASQAATRSLLDKAHALEARDRMDLAVQTWHQVLLADPNNAEALAGLARAAMAGGNEELARSYLARLAASNPNDPNIARIEKMAPQQDQDGKLKQAATLAGAGQYAAAMEIYRQLYGDAPPPGDTALAYYDTQAATEDGRPKAVAGLRALVAKYPSDARYQIALGRTLTFDPLTRDEGLGYLERYPKDKQAAQALRQALLWDAANPAAASRIRAYLAAHSDPQLALMFHANQPQPPAPAAKQEVSAAKPAPPAEKPAIAAANPAAPVAHPSPPIAKPAATHAAPHSTTTPEIAAYEALNAKHVPEAESRFQAILAQQPNNASALAGMGYVRMQQGNFIGAISFLEQSKQANPNDPTLTAALDTSRFWFLMGEGQAAVQSNDMTAAAKDYRTALGLRPDSPEALLALASTLQKAQQPQAAIPLLERVVAAQPESAEGWSGLFEAQYQTGNAQLALATADRIPAAVRTQLQTDPAFLQMLASADFFAGRTGEAQKALESAEDAANLSVSSSSSVTRNDIQVQLAGFLAASNQLEPAAMLYRQVIALDRNKCSAWQGLVQTEHSSGNDAEALATLEGMPDGCHATAMRDPGFETTAATIYQQQGKSDQALGLLQKAVADQSSTGQKPPAEMQMALARVYLDRGTAQLAYPLYKQVLLESSNHPDAWVGLVLALHLTGHDSQAIEQLQLLPAAMRARLEADPTYLQTMASVYGALGQSHEAAQFLARVDQTYAAQRSAPPATVEIENAWLCFNGLDDTGLYRQLLSLGSRPGLTDPQRKDVQTIWTDWAVRRANQAAAVGNVARSLAILNADAQAFPDNPAILKELANGYMQADQPDQAVAIYKAQNMVGASIPDYEAAVNAALAAGDKKQANIWLHYALAKYPADPQIQLLGAQVEQARGDTAGAVRYYRNSLKAIQPTTPIHAGLPGAPAPVALAGATPAQELSILLAPGNADSAATAQLPAMSSQSPLPPYNGAQIVPLSSPSGAAQTLTASSDDTYRPFAPNFPPTAAASPTVDGGDLAAAPIPAPAVMPPTAPGRSKPAAVPAGTHSVSGVRKTTVAPSHAPTRSPAAPSALVPQPARRPAAQPGDVPETDDQQYPQPRAAPASR